MNLHEYQAKKLFSQYGLPVPNGEVAHNVEDALMVFKKFLIPVPVPFSVPGPQEIL